MKNKNEMTYERCFGCPHCKEYENLHGDGLILECDITGNSLEVKECPRP